MPTALDWVNEAKNQLYSGYQEQMNKLDTTPMDASQTTINLAYDPQGLAQGTVIAIDLEEMYVWGVSTRQLTVERGFNGSTKAAHVAGSLIVVKPKFSTFRVFNAINYVIGELSSPDAGLFQVKTADIPYNPVMGFYDLPGDILAPIAVDYYDSISDLHPVHQWDFLRGQDVTLVPSGQALRIWDGFPGQNLRVTYKAPFVKFTALTDDVTVTRLWESAYDLPPLGAFSRLVPPRDVKRTFTEAQGEPSKTTAVPPGSSRQAVQLPESFYQSRVAQERTRLQEKYPYVLA